MLFGGCYLGTEHELGKWATSPELSRPPAMSQLLGHSQPWTTATSIPGLQPALPCLVYGPESKQQTSCRKAALKQENIEAAVSHMPDSAVP